MAVETGVDGVDVVIGTSKQLREHSHGKDMAYITKTAIEVIEYVKRYVSEGSWKLGGGLDCGLTCDTAKDAKSDSHPKILSDLTLLICYHCTRLSMPLASTVSVSLTLSAVPLLDKSTTWSAR